MAEGRSKAIWQHTGEILAALWEPHRDRKKRSKPFTAFDFNPHLRKHKPKKEQPIATVSMRQLHEMMPTLADDLADLAERKR